MPRDGSSTRSEILDAAMTLFVEHGYDKTSLREIAEVVGVTKAALYYHFKTKDDIVRAAMAEYYDTIGDVVDWLGTVPPGRARDEELVERVIALFDGRLGLALRFSQSNPTVMGREEFQHGSIDRLERFVALVAGPDATAEATLRATLAFGALVVGAGAPDAAPVITGTLDERRAAGRTVALELLARIRKG
jgi:AcrR family transcriptional regulator